MKHTKIFLIITSILFILGSCATASKPAQEDSKPEEKPQSEKKILGIPESVYNASVKQSLVSSGNNYLLKNVLQKLADGEENVYIAALGGSVTEGAGPSNYTDGYAFQFVNLLKAYYAKDSKKVIFDAAGLSGTPSALGLVRYQKDVVETLKTNPDILIIEFAVNDWQECSNTRGFEYLIRNALENNTAVIALYSAATYGNQQGAMHPVAKFYDVPEVSISDGLKLSGINQQKNSGIYYTDTVHPTKEGHKFMCDCLENLLTTIQSEEMDVTPVIPEEYYNKNAFENWTTIDRDNLEDGVTISEGGFVGKDKEVQGLKKGGLSFPNNWYYDGSNSESFKLTLDCKSMIFVYKNAGNWGNGNNFGNADVYVDGILYKTFNGKNNGWNNCEVVMPINESETKTHTVEVKMKDGEEAKKFTICAIGYSK